MSAPLATLLRYGPDSAIYQLLSEEELASKTEALLLELKLEATGATAVPEHEALVTGGKDASRTPLDTPGACAGRTYDVGCHMMLHIGEVPPTSSGRGRNTSRSHDFSLQKRYSWAELPVISSLRDAIVSFFGLPSGAIAGANLCAYRGPAAVLKPRKDVMPPGLEGPVVYSVSLSHGAPWRYVWKTDTECASFDLPSGSINVLGQDTNRLGSYAVPASTKRTDEAWRVSINFLPAAVAAAAPQPVLFYRNHPFSNFWICERYVFVLPPCCRREGFPHEFRVVCAETAIMLTKAVLMGDRASMQQLIADTSAAEADPRGAATRRLASKAKQIGRRVAPFDFALWDRHCTEVAYSVVLQKFSASGRLRDSLLATGNRRIAEASPRDFRWGIGVGCHHPRAKDPEQWPQGGNLLGKALERTRETLGGEPPAKRRRLAQPVQIRPWGVFIASTDAALPADVLEGVTDLLSPEATAGNPMWQQLGKAKDGDSFKHLRRVCGGRRTADIAPPPEARALLDAAAATLRSLGQDAAAELTERCDNISMNIYRKGARLPLHQDPDDYEPFIICVSLYASRTMTFAHTRQGRQTLEVGAGDIYMLRGEGYTEWTHGMLSKAPAYAASVTGRVRRSQQASQT